MKVTYPLSLVLLVLGLAACGGSVEPVDLRGTWSGGGATDGGQGFTLALNVTEVSEDGSRQLVSATAVFKGDLEDAVEMSGAFGGSSLTLRSQGGANQATLQLAISMSGSFMEGQGSLTHGGETIQLTFVLAKDDSAPDLPPCGVSSRFGTGGRSSCSPPPP